MPATVVLAGVLALVVAVQTALGGPAGALPRGAYWYSLLKLPQVWSITRGAGVTVAVIDDGVQAGVGDLKGQVLSGLDLSGTNPGAQHEAPGAATPQFGHGTDMAALIAGTGRGGGMIGLAPSARILPIDAFPNRNGATNDSLARGIRWAVDHHASVINLSLGAAEACPTVLRAAAAYAYRHDVVVVASTGDVAAAVYAPANCPGVLGVGAVDAAFRPWSTSASGPEVDFVAPGVDLVNEQLDGTLFGPDPRNAGTSQAAAIVSGTFALLRAKFPHDSARQIVTRALHHVHNGLGKAKLGTRINDTLGYGMVLPYYALTEATPATAGNPIYDRFASTLGTASGSSPSSSTQAASTPAAGSSTPAGTAGPSSTTASQPVQSSGGGGGSVSPLLIALVVVVVVALVALVLGLRRRNRRPPPGAFGGPPPPGWGGH